MHNDPQRGAGGDTREDPPPFFGTWNRLYAAVLVYLALIILLLGLFSRLFS